MDSVLTMAMAWFAMSGSLLSTCSENEPGSPALLAAQAVRNATRRTRRRIACAYRMSGFRGLSRRRQTLVRERHPRSGDEVEVRDRPQAGPVGLLVEHVGVAHEAQDDADALG